MTEAMIIRHRHAYRLGHDDGERGEESHRPFTDPAMVRLYTKGYVAGKTERLLCDQGVAHSPV